MAIPTTTEEQYKRLRSYLNPYLKGPNVDAVLYALAQSSAAYLINSVASVNDQLYITTASGRYLDERLAQFGISRPPSVGLSDEVFSQIGIAVKNRKQVRDLIHELLNAIFGDEFVRASNAASKLEPYHLQDGDGLIIKFDDHNTITITFSANEFSNIATATAQEVADSITKNIRNIGLKGTAIAKNDGNGAYVEILSDTIGPSSSVTVLGGSAQNQLQFDEAVAAGGNTSTQWTITLQPGGLLRYTWSGGANPQLGKVTEGNYVNIFGGGFSASANEGSYTILTSVGGAVNNSYFEILNPLGVSGIVTQGNDSAVLFYNPVRKVLASKISYAAAYQTQAKLLQIFLPAATKVVRRERRGSAHIHDPSDPISLLPHQEGPYGFDLTQPFTVSNIGTTLTQTLDGSKSRVVNVANSSNFPDQLGYLILGYGSQNQEGPIPYIARPSSNTLLISPSYTIKNSFNSGDDVSLVALKSAPTISQDGFDFPLYVTDIVGGRQYVQNLIQSVSATGINIVFTILYPSDQGLSKWGTPYSEISTIYGE